MTWKIRGTKRRDIDLNFYLLALVAISALWGGIIGSALTKETWTALLNPASHPWMKEPMEAISVYVFIYIILALFGMLSILWILTTIETALDKRKLYNDSKE